MIKHHPTIELLQSYVNGDLPASLSAGISIHAEMCPKCQHTISQLTEQIAERSFEVEEGFHSASIDKNNVEEAFDYHEMINQITSSDNIDVINTVKPKTVTFKNTQYTLPRVLNSMEIGRCTQIGKLAKSRLQLDEGEIHTNLLHIEPGGGVPQHTHKGFELTVLLSGAFHDEKGEYVKGDFIMLDGTNTHQPISDEGCLCYTVANDALHFTQGINKLLNPIGAFIY